MEAIEVVITVLVLGVSLLAGRLWYVSEKRRDERHEEMIKQHEKQGAQLNNIIESIQKEIRSIREEMSVELRKRDIQISDNRHQIKNITANMMMMMADKYPEFAKVLEKFMDIK